MLNEEFFDYRYKNSVTIEGERTDTTPYPTTERVVYHIENDKICARTYLWNKTKSALRSSRQEHYHD